MLQIKNVRKKYVTAGFEQIALDDVSLNLRDNEFVAILGPSGSGKTTMLNIIGGLDKYDSGDLIIDGISTQKYKDRDWDSYRNHSVGFVFQSYNLIPHQTILKNVELALTIGGISGAEREQRALDALEQVGLKEQAHKKPNQMSGGQMQRVAIARALVNDPKILLADEPTGALDTKTSVQVMDLLKEVAKDRLVVMVTHNPELADEYANRIVRLKDGQIISDTHPFAVEEEGPGIHKNLGKASMSLLTSFGLSLNNLMTKKGRTILTAFAGSIGIIGIALILSLSTGFQNYIDQVQDETMNSYPLTITEETSDFASALLTMQAADDVDAEENTLEEQQYIKNITDSVSTNDLKSFKKYLEENPEEYEEDVQLIKYNYGISPLIYTIDSEDNVAQLNPNSLVSSMQGSMSSLMSSMYASSTGTFTEITDVDLLKDEYDLLYGEWPDNYDELVLCVSAPDQISDFLLYSLGFRDTEELQDLIVKIYSGEEAKITDEPMTVTYDEILNMDLKLINPTDLYSYNEKYDVYEDKSDNEKYMRKVYENAEDLHVVGIICDTENQMTSGMFYMPELTYHVMDLAADSEIVQKQLENPDVDVFSGNKFDDENSESGLDFQDMITIDQNALSSAFKTNLDTSALSGLTNVGSGLSEEQTAEVVMEAAEAVADNLEDVTKSVESGIETADTMIAKSIIDAYVSALTTNVDGTDYLVLSQYGVSTADAFKEQALSDSAIQSAVSQAGGDISLDAGNVKKIATEAFDSYVASLSPDENGLVPVSDLPSSNSYAASAVANNQSAIFEEAYNLASEYTTGLVAQGMGQAVGETMAPLAESLSGLSALSDMFSGDIISIDTDKFAEAFQFNMSEDDLSSLMNTMMSGEETSYANNLLKLGYQDIDEPTSISFYFESFEAKNNFSDFLTSYNDSVDEEQKLTYTDITGILMGSVETIINAVTYVLIAFVSISLIVSSIMIGIITYISVLERTKEIGILRAIGASKRNISNIFNAETFIIGMLSGVIGVVVTRLLLFPINHVIHAVTDIDDITAVLVPGAAVILVIIATVLTMIGGLIPSKSASKKDPVIALRTE